ncbi:MAG: von Willebrand factor type A domain-containing protein [Marinilabiliaceae bacterium]|nr:von Willebrand factor type A domain-containing protein [Marinilabiliaceae bacterium]
MRILFFVLVIIMSGVTYSQSVRVISGIVIDENNNPLYGVNVYIKGNNNGCITDTYGSFSLKVAENDEWLVFSYIGYETKQINIKGKKNVNVKMELSNYALDELVVVDYSKGIIKGGAKIRRFDRSVMANCEMEFSAPMSYQMQDFNAEGYSTVHDNGFKDVLNEPLSTFSVDVDRASYSNVRRFLNNGQLPPIDAVRIEEMINYFNYNYPQPKGDDPFSISSEMAVCPWNNEHYLLKLGLKGKEIDKTDLPSSNIVFLIDVSGSMEADNKLPLLKSAFGLLVNELRKQDRVSVVVYAGAAGMVLKSTSGDQKDVIMSSLNNLQAGGSTAGGEGLNLAYKIAGENFIEGGNNRIILATDGDFNIGASSNAEMERMIEQKREKGIFITVLGFGMGNYKDDKMEIIADKGNGNYVYIDNLQEAQKTLVSEFGGTLYTIAKDVKFQIEFNPKKIAAYRLIGYENRVLNNEDFNDDKKDAGDIGAGHTVTALYEIVPIQASDAETYKDMVDELKYQVKTNVKNSLLNEWMTLKLRYKQPDGQKSKLIVKTVSGSVKNFENATDDLQFAASVAGFGMLLRKSEYVSNLSFEDIKNMALKSKGSDIEGYRGEMVRLIGLAKGLKKEFVLK